MPVYIGKSGDLVGWHRCLTDRQTTEYRATQLLSSIQFKLSHAIYVVIFVLIFWIFQHFFLEIAELACRQNCQPISFWACTKHRRIVLQHWIEAILITKQYKESLILWKNAKMTDHHICVLIIKVLNQNLILKSALFMKISKELSQR